MKKLPHLPQVNPEEGLSHKQAALLFEHYGPNQIEKKARASALKIFFSQFASPLILILFAAAIVTYFLADYVDMFVILAAVSLNTMLGFYQEYKAQRDLEALSDLLTPQTRVLRGGAYQAILSTQLVPGDIVSLSAGETIGGDGVIIQSKNLMINESLLTGESLLVGKRAIQDLKRTDESFVGLQEREIQENSSSVYMGTTVAAGTALMRVLYTGNRTEIGTIAHQLSITIDDETPLQLRLKRLGSFLTVTVIFVALALFIVGIFNGYSFEEIFTLSVAVAVSAIPEGLAVSLTAILAISMQRILKRKALVRKLLAAEVLGSVSVICCDKTGTLTEGKMKITQVESLDTNKILQASLWANNMSDPLEVGMWEWALTTRKKQKLTLPISEKLLDQLPFDSETRFAAKLFQKDLFVVGAPETVLAFCSLNKTEKMNWQKKVAEMAASGLRIVAFAHAENRGSKTLSLSKVRNLAFLGLMAFEDPIRRGVANALAQARLAGVDVKVITGDYRETARVVLHNLGWDVSDDQIMEGQELSRLTEKELQRKVGRVCLFVRTTPSQKLKIVEALQARDEVVAMTGDGVNDAPALKKADIGVVVSTASDVSKETADVVLLNNNFSTIVAAIEEGRGIFDNLRKVLLYLLSDSFTEVLLVFVSVILSIPVPITAAQILWINLVDDGLPNLALTLDPKEPDLLKRKPRRKNEPLFDLEIKTLVALISCVTAALVLGVFWWYLQTSTVEKARTVAFAMLAVDSLLYVFSSRSLRRPIWKDGLFKNRYLFVAVLIGFCAQLVAMYVPFFQRVFMTVPLQLADWMVIALSSLVVMGVVEGTKWLFLHPRQDMSVAKV